MKYKNFLFSAVSFVLGVFYFFYKRLPTIQQALITDGYQLVSSSENKKEIYKAILERNKNDINLIALDSYLIRENRKWEALSFWCDLETNKNSFLRRLGIYKKFCVMAIADDLLNSTKSYVSEGKYGYLSKEQRDYFVNQIMKKKEPQNLEEVLKDWNSWCVSERIEPIWKLNFQLAENVLKYCYVDND